MKIQHFYDQKTFTLTYVVYDEASKDAIIIDPVLDFDPPSGNVSFTSFDKLKSFVESQGLNIGMILETHAHADHLSASQKLKEHFPNANLGISEHIKIVQETFKNVFNLGDEFKTDGSQFDLLFKDGEDIHVGNLSFKVIHTPGHTPACASYYFDNAVFTGDTLFMPDFGTGRCDFPGGSAKQLYNSIHKKLYELPDATMVLVGHDYQPDGRDLQFISSIKEEKLQNCHLKLDTSETDFISMREERDKGLQAPKILLPSIQVNIDGGKLPEPEANGVRYMKLPIRGI